MLTAGQLVVGGLNLKAHVLQRQADVAPDALAAVDGGHVKIAGLIPGMGGGLAVLGQLEQEKLALRPHIKRIAHGLSLLDGALEHIARVAHKGRAVVQMHVANQARHALMPGDPGQYGKGRQIREQAHVAFLNAHIPFDGAAVDGHLVVERALQLGGGEGHILELPKDIRKLEADKSNALFLYDADDVLPCHGNPSPSGQMQGRPMLGSIDRGLGAVKKAEEQSGTLPCFGQRPGNIV